MTGVQIKIQHDIIESVNTKDLTIGSSVAFDLGFLIDEMHDERASPNAGPSSQKIQHFMPFSLTHQRYDRGDQ